MLSLKKNADILQEMLGESMENTEEGKLCIFKH